MKLANWHDFWQAALVKETNSKHFSAFITKFCKPIKNHESIDARLPPKSLPLFLPGRSLATGPGRAGEGGGCGRGRSGLNTCWGGAAACRLGSARLGPPWLAAWPSLLIHLSPHSDQNQLATVHKYSMKNFFQFGMELKWLTSVLGWELLRAMVIRGPNRAIYTNFSHCWQPKYQNHF